MQRGKTLYISDDDQIDINKNELIVFLDKDSEKYPNKLPLLEDFTNQQSKLRGELLRFNELILDRIKKYFDYDDDYKYILSSSIFEKSPYKTEYAYNFFKIILIIEYIKKYNIKEIYINSNKQIIKKFFKNFSYNNEINFISQKKKKKFNLKKLVMKNSFLSTAYIIKKEFQKIKFSILKNKQLNKNLVISYFPNYKFNDKNEFISNYFGDISNKLNTNHDWLFIYANDIDKIKNDEKLLDEKNFKQYNFLDAYISYNDCKSLLKKINVVRKKLRKINLTDIFIYKNVDYYEILIEEWEIFLSYYLVESIVFEKKFKNFFNSKKYSNVLYLLEYQPWEQMLNKTLQVSNPACETKAITHSVFRPNLMNYYYPKNVHNCMYTSKVVASNSEFSKKMLIKNGYNSEDIKEIEAQRFNYLSKINKVTQYENNLLIITSINFSETATLLKIFSGAIGTISKFDNIFIKPHPFMPIDNIISSLKYFPKFKILNGNMDEALNIVSTVLVTNSSSTLLESILYGKKTITLFSLDTLPMPAIDKHDLLFPVTSINEMRNILYSIDSKQQKQNDNFLYLNHDYLKWNKFLNQEKIK